MNPFIVFTFLFVFLISCNDKVQSDGQPNPVVDNHSISQAPTEFYKSNTIAIDKNIRSIFQDKKGTYWFGTNGAGVYRYDKTSLTQFTEKDGLANNQILSIQEDELGNIWFGTGVFGVSKFDGSTFTTYTSHVKTTKGTDLDWKPKPNDLWFYAGGGALRYSDSSLTYLPFPQTGVNSPFALSRYAVYCMLKDRKKIVGSEHRQKACADTTENRLFGLRKKDWQALQFLVYLKTVKGTCGLVITAPGYSNMMEKQ